MLNIKKPTEKPYEWFLGIAVSVIIALMGHFEWQLNTVTKVYESIGREIAIVRVEGWKHEDQEKFIKEQFSPAMVQLGVVEDRLKILKKGK